MEVATAEKLRKIRNKIDALRKQESKLLDDAARDKERELEREWRKENNAAAKFCKSLIGKALTFHETAIYKVLNARADGTQYEEDCVSVRYIKRIHYRDTDHIMIIFRAIYADNDSGYIRENDEANYSIYDLTGASTERTGGRLHILSKKELNKAFKFWHERMAEIYSSRFTVPEESAWFCRHDLKKES